MEVLLDLSACRKKGIWDCLKTNSAKKVFIPNRMEVMEAENNYREKFMFCSLSSKFLGFYSRKLESGRDKIHVKNSLNIWNWKS